MSMQSNKVPVYYYGIELYKNSSEDDLLYILAYVIDACNYNCEYCYNKRPYTKKMLDLNVLYEYIFYIQNKFPTKYIQLELIGGEPTLHPDLLNFCKKIKHFKNFKLKIFTNLSKDIDVYSQILQNQNAILIASWHSLPYDSKNSNFCNKIIQLTKNFKSQIEVRIMYEKNNSENAIDVANQLVKHSQYDIFDLSLVFDPKDKDNQLYSYSQSQLNAFELFHEKNEVRSNRHEFLVKYSDGSSEMKTFSEMFCNKVMLSCKRWLCNAGKNSQYIDYDGFVYPCVEYAYDKKNSMFNINDKNFGYCDFKQTLCKVDYCTCDWDIKKTKIFA